MSAHTVNKHKNTETMLAGITSPSFHVVAIRGESTVEMSDLGSQFQIVIPLLHGIQHRDHLY